MRLLKTAAKFALHRAGGLALARRLNRKGVRIVVYHRFPVRFRSGFEEQCRDLRRTYNLVPLSSVSSWLRGETVLPPHSLAITVDDGYRDFFRVAYPTFHALRIPVTVFLTTDFLDRKSWLWVDRVRCAFTRAGRSESEARQFIEAAKKLPNAERLQVLAELECPEQAPTEYAPLSWDEVRAMARDGVEFGAHTRSHPILSRLGSAGERADEIAGSKLRIEQELGSPVRHFCYPNGTPGDIDAASVDAVRQAGFETAVTMAPGLNFPGADPLALKRIAVGPDYPPAYVRQLTAGFVA